MSWTTPVMMLMIYMALYVHSKQNSMGCTTEDGGSETERFLSAASSYCRKISFCTNNYYLLFSDIMVASFNIRCFYRLLRLKDPAMASCLSHFLSYLQLSHQIIDSSPSLFTSLWLST